MHKFKECTVGGRKYSISLYNAREGLAIGAELVKVLGVPFAHLFAKGKGGQVGELLPVAIEALAGRLHEDEVVNLVLRILKTTTFDGAVLGEESVFDLHFQGRLGDLFKVLAEVVQYQFKDFFSVAVSAGLKEMAREKAAQSHPTSNG